MPDHATSSSPAVQTQLDRIWTLSPGADILGLSRITELLARLGDPHLRLPPVFHVAGTNGKGSTCAFLRAGLEGDGRRVHVYTSPHLVRFNERIRVAGKLIDDVALAALLARVLDDADGIGASFFEVTTAAAFLAFAEIPADACVIEVGLGGRLDATNVVDPVVCGIAQLGIDHEAFLGADPIGIAREKAGIAKHGAPLVISRYSPTITSAIEDIAAAAGAPVVAAGRDWHHDAADGRLRYRDAAGSLDTPLPRLVGTHQLANLALAIAMLRHQRAIAVSPTTVEAMPLDASWPARMQRLRHGPLTGRVPEGTAVWLDGGHNAAAADAIAATLPAILDARAHLVVGMLANKDARGFLAPFAPFAESLTAVPVPDHAHHAPEELAAIGESLGMASGTAPDITAALDTVAKRDPAPVLILGSLYLAGEVLRLNDEAPA